MRKQLLNNDLSQQFRAVSFLCACLVVPIHCWSPSEWFAGSSGLRVWEAALAFLFTDTISRCAVPCFFVMSGFFLALKFEPTLAWYRDTLKKRFFSLYVPFVIWNILYLIRNSILEHQNLFSAKTILGYDLFVSPGFGLFWYVQVILLAVLVSPLWLPILRSRIGAALSIVALTIGWITGNFGHYFSLQLSAENFLWLFCGASVAFHLAILARPRASVRILVATGLAIAIATHVTAGGFNIRMLLAWSDMAAKILGVFTIFANSHLILKALNKATPLFSLSFFIYAMHPQGLLIHIPLDHIGAPFLVTYFARIICGVALPIVLGLVLRRFIPKVMLILTGKRS